MEFLILTSGPHRGQILELPEHSERPIRIGRDDAEICLGDDHVSRMHAELHVCPGGWRVSDLGSSNGTFVNDVRVDRAHRLEDGDRLDVGHTALVFGCLSDERLAELEDFDPSGVDNAADRLLMAQIIRQTYLQTESEPTEGSEPVLDSAGDCLPLVVAGPVSPEPANSGAGIAGVLVVAAMLIGLNMFLVARAGTESDRLTKLIETAEGNPVSTADALLPEVEQIVTNHRDPAVDLIADRTLALADQSTQYQARFESLMDKVLAAVHQGPGAREVERLDRIHAVVTAGPDPKERERLAEIHAAVTAGPNPEEAKRLADIHAAVTAPPDPGPQRLLQEIRAGVLAGTETEAGLQHRLAEVDSRLQELVKRDPQPVLQKILAEARTSSRVAADAGATHRLLQEIQAALADQREATVARKETEKVLGQILAELRSGRKEAPATPEPKRVVVQAKAKAKPTVQILHRRRDRVVFLVDASESVADDFPLVLDELDHLLATLQSGQEFNILFCRGSEVVVSPPSGLKDVGSGDRGRIMAWARGGMDGTRPGGRFNPANALRLAMQDRPQRIWLLSNAFGGAGQAAERRRLTRLFELAHAQSGIRVDAIQLFASDRYDTLRTISESSGGTYTFVVHPGGPREVEASRAD